VHRQRASLLFISARRRDRPHGDLGLDQVASGGAVFTGVSVGGAGLVGDVVGF
jgi:hypothetical protein